MQRCTGQMTTHGPYSHGGHSHHAEGVKLKCWKQFKDDVVLLCSSSVEKKQKKTVKIKDGHYIERQKKSDDLSAALRQQLTLAFSHFGINNSVQKC